LWFISRVENQFKFLRSLFGDVLEKHTLTSIRTSLTYSFFFLNPSQIRSELPGLLWVPFILGLLFIS
jgi:hypothetical protein